MLLARIAVFLLFCPRRGEPMRITAFVPEVGSLKRICEHLGEPTTPRPIASARGPSHREEDFDRREGTEVLI